MNHRTPFQLIVLSVLALLLITACGGVGITALAPEPVLNEVLPPPETALAAPAESVQAPETAVVPPPAPVAPQTAVSAVLASILAQQQAFIDLYNNVNPSVVAILTNGGQGSGFVFDNNGHIITNNHVVEGVQQIQVQLFDGKRLDARLIGRDPGSDLAVLQVDTTVVALTPVPLGDSDALQVGQIVVAIGSPFGLQSTMTTGIISALDRLFPGTAAPNGQRYSIPDIIQTDAAINPGNSGGPLLDLYGNVIGVNTAIESPVRGSSGIGLAVPSNIVAVVAPQLIANGTVSTPWIGISGAPLSPELANELGLSVMNGFIVGGVVAGSPADVAGLIPANPATGLGGDVIVSIDDEPIVASEDLLGYLVQRAQVGQTVQLQVLRDGSLINVAVTLQARPAG